MYSCPVYISFVKKLEVKAGNVMCNVHVNMYLAWLGENILFMILKKKKCREENQSLTSYFK